MVVEKPIDNSNSETIYHRKYMFFKQNNNQHSDLVMPITTNSPILDFKMGSSGVKFE